MFQKDTLAIRVLAGTNVFFEGVGAIAEFVTRSEQKLEFAQAFELELRKVLDALEWDDVNIYKKVYSNGMVFAIPTEFDYTFAGTKILSVTFDIVAARFNGQPELDFADEVDYLDYVISRERYMTLRNIYNEAQARSLNVYYDGENISIGSGKGSFTAKIDEVGFDDVPWDSIYDIPSILVTGTNGKTTTVRLTSFISQNSGKVVGYCSTDWVMINGEVVSEGDLSGPNGNRTVMTNKTVDVAVLEVARGGIVKRGLATSHVNGAVVMNVSEDHLGVNGIDSVYDLAAAKFVVQDAVKPGGHHIFNLDDEVSRGFISKFESHRAFFSQKLSLNEIKPFLKDSNDYACFVQNDTFVVYKDGKEFEVAKVNDVDLTFKGIAKHNIENVLGAICLSLELGRTVAEISAGLLAFRNSEHNRGRFNMFDVKSNVMLIDYGHNFASVDNMLKFAKKIVKPTGKVTALLGFSGDRKFMIKQIAKSVVDNKIDNVILKLFTSHLRGAEVGELADMLQNSLLKFGFSNENIVAKVETELEAFDLIMQNPGQDNIYVLLCQDDAAVIIDKIKALD